MYQVFMETTAKAKQEAEEICLGQETHEMEIRPVKSLLWCDTVCPNLRSAVLPCLFRTRKKERFSGLYVHGSHREARRRSSDSALLAIRLGIYSPSLSLSQPLSS